MLPTKIKLRTRRLLQFVADWNEFWGIPLALFLFIVAPQILRIFDPTAGAYDLSVLQALLFGLAAFMFVKGLVWLLIRMDFPKLYKFLDNRLDAFYLTNYTPKYATLVAVAIYALYLVLLTILVVALL